MAEQERDGEPAVEVLDKADDRDGGQGNLILARDVLPDTLPIVPVGRPLFPRMTLPMVLGSEGTRAMIESLLGDKKRHVGLVLRRGPTPGDGAGEAPPARPDDLYDVGVVAEIQHAAQSGPQGPIQMIVSTHDRFRVDRYLREEPWLLARVRYIAETDMTPNDELKAYSLSVVNSIKELVKVNPLHKEELSLLMQRANLSEPGRLADIAAALTTADPPVLQEVLETLSIRRRLHKVLELLRREIEISALQTRIQKQIEERLSKQQREFFLREQLKAIKKELGLAKEGKAAEVERFEQRLAELNPTPEARGRIEEELEKLRLLEPNSPEFAVARAYLDWLTILPWGVHTEDVGDLARAERILDEDHFGLEDVKQRIVEFLAVGLLKGRIAGSILCFVGPPGVGKTSVGRSIARAIGRNFYRFSLGGMRDEAEIKGHRRTYIGAMPGKFLQAIRACRSANPVIMLDEVDKIGASFQGDPASALLEVLDPEQNRDFLDHYLDVRFDLSNVFFICTANQEDTIPRPLLDRMEVIRLAGYILEEKLEIARRYLVPKQREAHGLKTGQLRIDRPALRAIVDGYAREPGVRGLEQCVRKVARKAARRLVAKEADAFRVKAADVPEWLGRRRFRDEARRGRAAPGVATGLAWTSLGGETLQVEATAVETGEAGFKQTGQLGKVMVESSEIAYTVVRAWLDGRPEGRAFFARRFIHLHVPAGATPKDGPSAGVTMAAALSSLALGRPLRAGLAMTGELTLTGRVMPVGGIKEKAIAAKRAGVRRILLPAENREEYEELPSHIRRGLDIRFVRTFDETMAEAFPGGRGRKSQPRKS